MMNRSQLKFHETFQPETTYIAKILDLAAHNYSGSKFEISEITGIPTGRQKGKVEPHIKYASYMGLINYTCERGVYSLSLSTVGKIVFAQDRYLHENLTRWLCHYEISRERVGAPQWYYLVHLGHSELYHSNTAEHQLIKANSFFNTNIDSEEMFGVVKRSYLNGFFSDLYYIRWNDGPEYIEHSSLPELLYLYAYVIVDSWSNYFPEKAEITFTDLIEKIEIGKVFNLSNENIDSIITDLEFEGILKVNRQLFPLTIMCTSDLQHIISQLYSQLL